MGPYAITQGTVTNANNPNYTITYVGANLSITARPITVTAVAKSKVYGDADPALTFTNSSLGAGVDVNGALTRASGESVNGGPYAITQGTVTNANNPNYTITYVGANLTITARPITVTAVAKSKVYGDADPALTFTNSSLGAGVDVNGALTRASGESVNGGPYAITQGTVTNANNPNYTITYVGANLSITARPITVTAVAKSKVYGDADPALTFTNSSLGAGVDVNGALTRASGESVDGGPYAITQGTVTNANNPNYTITYVGANLSITRASITIAADNKSKQYGDPNPTFTGTILGVRNSDPITLTFTTVADATSVPGTYVIVPHATATAAVLANYTVAATNGTLTISAREAPVAYIGQTVFTTSGSSSTTAQVTLSASVQDTTGSGATLTNATVTFTDLLTGKVLATGVKVTPVSGSSVPTGTANTVVTLSSGQYGAQGYLIEVSLGGMFRTPSRPAHPPARLRKRDPTPM